MEKNAVITIVAKKTVEFKDLKKKLEFLLKKKIELVDSFSTKILKKNTNQILIFASEMVNKDIFVKKFQQFTNQESKEFFVLCSKNCKSLRGMNNIKFLTFPIIINELFLDISKFLEKRSSSLNNQDSKFIYRKDKSIILNIKSNKKVKLTELENKFFEFMINVKKPVTKSEILSKVWLHQKDLDTHTLQSLIYRLRNKIEDNPKQPKFLVTVGKKYFLNYMIMFQ
ncbi:MAG: hypothetical protein CMM96_01805 [Rickettsiales bacterium]|nr:hypothetical protein [Rickettsiales bacterium]